jgi:hypothetical protein
MVYSAPLWFCTITKSNCILHNRSLILTMASGLSLSTIARIKPFFPSNHPFFDASSL